MDCVVSAAGIVCLVLAAQLGCASPQTTQRIAPRSHANEADGVHTERYPNGVVKWTVSTLRGRPHGVSETYHPNRYRASRGLYENGERDGLFEIWDNKGRLIRRVVYKNGEELWSTADENEPLPLGLETREEATTAVDEIVGPPITGIEFLTLPSPSHRSSIAVQLGFHSIPRSDALGHAYEIGGSYALGDYTAFGRIWTATITSPTGASVHGKTSFELGGRLHRHRSGFDLVASAGLILPIANDNFDGFVGASATSHERMTDVASTYPKSLVFRLGGSALRASELAFVGFDIGVDGLVRTSDDPASVSTAEPGALLGRFGLAAGFGLPSFTVAIESANIIVIAPHDTEFERLTHTLAAVLRVTRWTLHPAVGLALPLFSDTGPLSDGIPLALFFNLSMPIGAGF